MNILNKININYILLFVLLFVSINYSMYSANKQTGVATYKIVKIDKNCVTIRVHEKSNEKSNLILKAYDLCGKLLNIENNNVNLDLNDNCVIVNDRNKNIILCNNKRDILYKNICSKIVSKDDKPWLDPEFTDRYIGFVKLINKDKIEIYYLCK